jgi:hypothetical protein
MRTFKVVVLSLAAAACSASASEPTTESPSELTGPPRPGGVVDEEQCTLDSDCAGLDSKDDTSRVPECNNGTHRCELVPIDQVVCMSFIRNQHECPMGYACAFHGVPDVGGRCVAAFGLIVQTPPLPFH